MVYVAKSVAEKIPVLRRLLLDGDLEAVNELEPSEISREFASVSQDEARELVNGLREWARGIESSRDRVAEAVARYLDTGRIEEVVESGLPIVARGVERVGVGAEYIVAGDHRGLEIKRVISATPAIRLAARLLGMEVLRGYLVIGSARVPARPDVVERVLGAGVVPRRLGLLYRALLARLETCVRSILGVSQTASRIAGRYAIIEGPGTRVAIDLDLSNTIALEKSLRRALYAARYIASVGGCVSVSVGGDGWMVEGYVSREGSVARVVAFSDGWTSVEISMPPATLRARPDEVVGLDVSAGRIVLRIVRAAVGDAVRAGLRAMSSSVPVTDAVKTILEHRDWESWRLAGAVLEFLRSVEPSDAGPVYRSRELRRLSPRNYAILVSTVRRVLNEVGWLTMNEVGYNLARAEAPSLKEIEELSVPRLAAMYMGSLDLPPSRDGLRCVDGSKIVVAGVTAVSGRRMPVFRDQRGRLIVAPTASRASYAIATDSIRTVTLRKVALAFIGVEKDVEVYTPAARSRSVELEPA